MLINADVVVVIKMGAYIHGGAYFVWVLIGVSKGSDGWDFNHCSFKVFPI